MPTGLGLAGPGLLAFLWMSSLMASDDVILQFHSNYEDKDIVSLSS